MSTFKKLITWIIDLGVDKAGDLEERHRVRFVNKMLFVGTISVFIFSTNDYFIELYFPSLILFIEALFVIFCMYLNSKGYNNAAPFLALLSASLVIFTNAILILDDMGIQYILLSMTGLPALTIDPKRKYLMYSEMIIIPMLGALILIIETERLGIYKLDDLNQVILLYMGYFQGLAMMIFQTYIFLNEMDKRYNVYLDQSKKLENQTRMSDLGLMTAGIAHEINNPLAVINTSAYFGKTKLLKGDVDLSRIENEFDRIMAQSARIISIIKGLKFVSRDGSKDPFEDLYINEVVREAYFLCEHKLMSAKVESNYYPLKEDTRVSIRPVQIQQVILSLVSNAIDAMEEVEKKKLTLEIEQTENEVHIKVIDSGPGVPEKVRNQILKPFFTTKPVGKGTGLGLSVAVEIMNKHNGSLNLLSSQNGATFKLILPKSES